MPTSRQFIGGAWCDAGGSTPDGAGSFHTPTVMAAVPPGAPALTEENFGPVIPMIPFDDIDAALEAANSVQIGLASSVGTKKRRCRSPSSSSSDWPESTTGTPNRPRLHSAG